MIYIAYKRYKLAGSVGFFPGRINQEI